ncbi:MAG TPA: toll/interleukin-1 receptor domain-containing protein, partial [Thermoanaerobaculia bacterium]|nr:toll/interleukin-1 receptor domain-containing protein [Thermoanaerobaculia bacterium]
MPGPKVFVSYSQRDQKALEQLQRFLRPLERDGLLASWADTRIETGKDWKKEIDQALAEATVAVLLISQDFLSSEFIVREEIPRLLEYEAAGRMTILPVFLSPSLVEDIEFADPRTGADSKILLTKFQGYGRPTKPLSDLEWSDRERTYKTLAQSLLRLAGMEPAAGLSVSALAPVTVPVAVSSAGPARLFELTVQLETRGESLQITYHRPGLEPLGSVSLPWADLKQRIDSFHQTLDTALNRALLPQLGNWGEVLFDLLFGPVERWEPLLRAVFGRSAGTPRPNPVFGPLRLRIHAEDARLTGLPWRITSWKGQPLLDAGWTFTTTHTVELVEDQLTTAPANVLVVAPQTPGKGDGPHDPEHAQAV